MRGLFRFWGDTVRQDSEESTLRRTIATEERRFGAEDRRSIVAHVDLANYLQRNGRFQEADAEYKGACERCRAISPDGDENLLVLEYALAQSALRRGDLAEAKARLVQICRRSSSTTSAGITYLDSLAATLIRSRDYDCAKAILLHTLQMRRENASSEANSTISISGALVSAFLNAERWADALPLQRGIAQLLRDTGGNSHDVLLATSLLAVILVETGALAEAKDLLGRIAPQFSGRLGSGHPETLRILLLFGLVCEKEGDATGAREVIERSYGVAVAELGRDHEISIRLGTKLASILLRSGEVGTARRVLIDTLPASEQVLGRDCSTTLTNLNNLAVAYWNSGDKQLSCKIVEQLVERRRSAFGEDDPETLRSEQQLQAMRADTDPQIAYEGASEFGESAIVVRLRGVFQPR